jgi:hypothetical protein
MDLVCEQSIGVEREQRKSFGLLRCERGRLRMQPWLKYNWLVVFCRQYHYVGCGRRKENS